MALGRSCHHHLSAASSALGAEVDDPVGRLDHVEIVLDNHDRATRLDQPAKRRQQLADVVEVQAGGRLVEDVEDARVRLFCSLCDVLRRAASVAGARPASCAVPRRRRAWWPTGPAGGSPGRLRPARAASRRSSGTPEKKCSASLHGEVQHLVDVLAADNGFRALPACSACPCIPRRSARRRPGTASRR